MNIFAFIAGCLGGAVLGIRFVRWLAFLQQKEYRPDRLQLFLFSQEGVREFFRVIEKSDFTRIGLKRPKITLRILITAFAAGTGTLLLVKVLETTLKYFLVFDIFVWMGVFIVAFLLLPILVLVIGIVPGFLFSFYSYYLLGKAAEVIKNHQPLIIGITGSFGKTATKMLLAHVLAQKTTVFIPPRSHNTIYSISKSILDSYSQQKIAIIEYGAYKKGEIARLAKKLQPDLAIITGLTEQHLGLFGSLENIIRAKQELISALPEQGVVYVANESAEKITLGLDLEKYRITKVHQSTGITGRLTKNGTVKITWDGQHIQTQLVGLQYLDTIKTVINVAMDLKYAKEHIASALETFVPGSGFTRVFSLTNDIQVIDDGGTSNKQGFIAALNLLAALEAKKKIVVTSGIVDLGSESASIHQELAKFTHTAASEVWYLGKSGRDEFEAEFGKKFIAEMDIIKKHFAELPKNTALLVEGRMPGWFIALLESKKL